MKLRLRPRMVAGFLLMSALLIVVGIFTAYFTNRMQENTSRILVENVPSLKSTEELEIAFLDMKMPGYSGADLLRKIKKSNRKLPVIIMTAYSNIFTEKDALMLGADAYLKKPFEINTMLSKLRSLVNEHN